MRIAWVRSRKIESTMAEHTTSEGGHPDMDYTEHEWTYALFIKLIKWVLAVVILIMIFLAYMWG